MLEDIYFEDRVREMGPGWRVAMQSFAEQFNQPLERVMKYALEYRLQELMDEPAESEPKPPRRRIRRAY
jgi:hypothetical protein